MIKLIINDKYYLIKSSKSWKGCNYGKNELPRRKRRGIEPVGAVKKTAKDIFFDVSNLNRVFDCPIIFYHRVIGISALYLFTCIKQYSIVYRILPEKHSIMIGLTFNIFMHNFLL